MAALNNDFEPNENRVAREYSERTTTREITKGHFYKYMSAKTSIYKKLFYITAYQLKVFLQSGFEYTRLNGDKKKIYILGNFIEQDFIDICLERHLKMYTVHNSTHNYVRVLPPKYRDLRYNKAYKLMDVLLAFKKVEKEIDDSGKSFLNKKGHLVGITIEFDESIKANLRGLEKIVRKYYDPTNYGVRENSSTRKTQRIRGRVQTPYRVRQSQSRRTQTPARPKNTRRNTPVVTIWEKNLPV